MHIYGSLASPFVQRALMTARAKGHEVEARSPPGEGGMRSDEFRAISPMGRIPVLALDNGEHVCESEAIAGYLDDTLDGPSLLPDDALARARVRELIALALLEVGTGFRPFMVHLVFRMGDNPPVVDAARAQAEKGFDALDRLLDEGGPFATGGTLTAADCALVPILALAQIIDPVTGALGMADARPRVRAYRERVFAEPIPRRTVDEMVAAFAEIRARNAATN